MKKLKTSLSHRANQLIHLPIVGEVQFNNCICEVPKEAVDELLQMDHLCLSLVEEKEEEMVSSKEELIQESEKEPSTEPVKEEELTEEAQALKKELEGKDETELIKLTEDLGLPKAEWKKLKKFPLINYIISKVL